MEHTCGGSGSVARTLLSFKAGLHVFLVDNSTGKEQQLTHEQVLRSKLISDMLVCGYEGVTQMPISADLMRAWCLYIDPGAQGLNSCELLATIMQAWYSDGSPLRYPCCEHCFPDVFC
jgi:hypothetical protein